MNGIVSNVWVLFSPKTKTLDGRFWGVATEKETPRRHSRNET
jgi:hypothetical protein